MNDHSSLYKKVPAFLIGAFLVIGMAVMIDTKHALTTGSLATVIGSNETATATNALPWSPIFESPSTIPIPSHITTPESVRGIYLTSWTAGSRNMSRIYNLIETTSINAVVIDIKDATGRLSYQPLDQNLRALGVGTNRIARLPELISKLHKNGVYVIGRVQVFQDPFFAALYPEEAYRNTSTLEVWKDHKGISWLRANSQKTWEYTVAIAKDAYAQGFDEINVDYVRFPSDGNLSLLDKTTFRQSRTDTLEGFFQYLDTEIRTAGIPLSADIFGLTMSAKGDLGIGQIVEKIAPYVDYVCPMIYPSHYAVGSFGYQSPSEYPYEIISRALKDGSRKLNAMGENPKKLRPWLQDFDLLGVTYDAEKVSAQINASSEQGIDSWLLWDPRNIYTKESI